MSTPARVWLPLVVIVPSFFSAHEKKSAEPIPLVASRTSWNLSAHTQGGKAGLRLQKSLHCDTLGATPKNGWNLCGFRLGQVTWFRARTRPPATQPKRQRCRCTMSRDRKRRAGPRHRRTTGGKAKRARTPKLAKKTKRFPAAGLALPLFRVGAHPQKRRGKKEVPPLRARTNQHPTTEEGGKEPTPAAGKGRGGKKTRRSRAPEPPSKSEKKGREAESWKKKGKDHANKWLSRVDRRRRPGRACSRSNSTRSSRASRWLPPRAFACGMPIRSRCATSLRPWFGCLW